MTLPSIGQNDPGGVRMFKKRVSLLALLILMACSLNVLADEGTSTASLKQDEGTSTASLNQDEGTSTASAASDEVGSSRLNMPDALKNKKFEADHQITDTELKAQSGSLSRYSLKFDMSYSGPSVSNLSDPNMPNPDNRPRPNRTNLSGYMGLRYRINSDEAINASTGVHWYSPYHEVAGKKVNKRPGDQNYSLANPQVSYDRTYVGRGVQMRSSLSGSVTTEDYYSSLGQLGALGLDQSFKYHISDTRWVLGMLVPLDVFLYKRDYREFKNKAAPGDGKVSNYFLSFIPSVEYKLLKNLNLKTSLAYSYSNMRLQGSWWKWEEQTVSARLGFGWGITRDIYINPFLNVFVEHPKWATTSLSFSTVFSIF